MHAQVTEDGSSPRWARVEVKVDDHITVPTLDPAAVEADADRAVEEYVASLLTLPMDRSRPLWEFHVLDFPTSEAGADPGQKCPGVQVYIKRRNVNK
jgi:hypothetical protein